MSEIKYDHYPRYDEMTSQLEWLAGKYPGLMRLSSIGKSYEGREIWLATITNFETGEDQDKPALWIDGTIHSPEIAPTSTCIFIAEHLLENYGKEAEVTYALDTRAFYICPRVSPDGVEWLLADQPRLIYSSTRVYPVEEIAGGLTAQDLDGDGRMLMMRIPDPNGSWKISTEHPRLMVRRGPTERGGQYYRLMREGLFENFDGHQLKIKPREKNLDLNRNFPANWRPESDQPGAGAYPGSEPEVSALVNFVTAHPNITGAISLHTYSGAILRPYSDRSDDAFPPQDLHLFNTIGRTAAKLTGYSFLSTYHDARLSSAAYTTGTFDNWLYDQYGVYGWTVDMWDPHRSAGIPAENIGRWEMEHPIEDDLKLLAWSDEHMDGNGYVDWYSFDHPQLGKVELGGWNKLATFTNPPIKFLRAEMEKFPAWALYQALISPLLEIAGTEVETVGEGLYRVRLYVANTGWLPTYVAKKAVTRKVVNGVKCEIKLPAGASLLDGKAVQDIGQLEGRSGTPATIPGWPGGEPTNHMGVATWLVKGNPGDELTLEAGHLRAGKVKTTITLG